MPAKCCQRIAKNEKLDKVQRASMLAQEYGLLGDKEQAIANCREAARLDTKNPAVQVQLADCLVHVGTTANHPEAEALLPRRAARITRFRRHR